MCVQFILTRMKNSGTAGRESGSSVEYPSEIGSQKAWIQEGLLTHCVNLGQAIGFQVPHQQRGATMSLSTLTVYDLQVGLAGEVFGRAWGRLAEGDPDYGIVGEKGRNFWGREGQKGQWEVKRWEGKNGRRETEWGKGNSRGNGNSQELWKGQSTEGERKKPGGNWVGGGRWILRYRKTKDSSKSGRRRGKSELRQWQRGMLTE